MSGSVSFSRTFREQYRSMDCERRLTMDVVLQTTVDSLESLVQQGMSFNKMTITLKVDGGSLRVFVTDNPVSATVLKFV